MRYIFAMLILQVWLFPISIYTQAPIHTICDEDPEYQYETLPEYKLQIDLNEDVLEVTIDLDFRETPNYFEYSLSSIIFDKYIDTVFRNLAIENTLASLVVANPSHFGDGEWRLKVPACWAAIFDYCFELYDCIGDRSCITYRLDVIKSENCAETISYSNFRQNEYDLCRYSEDPCHGINKINIKRGISRITGEDK